MRELEMRGVKEPTNIEEIKKFEQLINAKLPDDYIEWLLKHNGGHPDFDRYDLAETDPDYTHVTANIAWFCALGKEYKVNLEYEYKVFINRIPYEMISIAYTSCGNQICLGVRDPYYGKLYLWDHEMEAGAIKFVYENFGIEIAMRNTGLTEEEVKNYGDEPTYKNIYLIANSFTEFINKLRPYEETL